MCPTLFLKNAEKDKGYPLSQEAFNRDNKWRGEYLKDLLEIAIGGGENSKRAAALFKDKLKETEFNKAIIYEQFFLAFKCEEDFFSGSSLSEKKELITALLDAIFIHLDAIWDKEALKAIDKIVELSLQCGIITAHAVKGYFYKTGCLPEKIPRNIDKAFECFQRGHDQGDIHATTELGLLYMRGEASQTKNDDEDIRWSMAIAYLQTAAEKNDPEGLAWLSELYRKGVWNSQKELEQNVFDITIEDVFGDESTTWIIDCDQKALVSVANNIQFQDELVNSLDEQGYFILKPNPQKSLDCIKKAVELGSPTGLAFAGKKFVLEFPMKSIRMLSFSWG